jgi:hypothetical protein
VRHERRTRTHVTRRTAQGLSEKAVMRLKRYVIPQFRTALLAAFETSSPPLSVDRCTVH